MKNGLIKFNVNVNKAHAPEDPQAADEEMTDDLELNHKLVIIILGISLLVFFAVVCMVAMAGSAPSKQDVPEKKKTNVQNTYEYRMVATEKKTKED